MSKRLFHQNGFTRTSLSATVTRVSNFVEENVFLLHRQGSPPRWSPVHSINSLPNTSNVSVAMHSACSKHWINVLRFTTYHVEGRLKITEISTLVDNFPGCQQFNFRFRRNTVMRQKVISHYLVLVREPVIGLIKWLRPKKLKVCSNVEKCAEFKN